uniref:Adenylate kinase 9 n=1 Tax=Poecilia reticulata TaxID=8081 RepID=A0A3P9MZW7_POERE
MYALVDYLTEDEAERAGLLAKPTCFVIFGRPVSSMRHLQFSSRTLWKLYIDLVKRLSGLKQHPETGQLHNLTVWQQEEELLRKSKEQEMDDADEDYEEVLSNKVMEPTWVIKTSLNTYHVWCCLTFFQDVFSEHNPIYLLELDGNDPPGELYLSVMARLETMAIKPVSVPILLSQHVEEELTDTISTEDLLRYMTSIRIVAPGFRWRRSRWGRICPVALKEGNIIQGEIDLCVGFQDKLYILSCQDAYHKFIANPRRYLLPPMPRPPCKVGIIGFSQAGKSTMCSLLAQHYGAVVLDLEELIKPFLAKADQERFEKLRDITTPAVKSMRKKKKSRESASGKLEKVFSSLFPSPLGPFQYVAWEFSSVDLTEEEEDLEALALLEEEESEESEDEDDEEEDVELASRRLLGDTKYFCPVAFKRNNVLWPVTDKISAKYRERTYYFSTIEARYSFIENPGEFVAQGELLKPPPLRIFMLGARGSGKTTNGEWLAKQLGLFHIQFKEQLQMKIMAKTYNPVPSADEAVYLKSDTEYVEEQIRVEKGEEEETENRSGNLNIDEMFLTEDELVIKAYLAEGEPLTNQVLDMVILPYFQEEPYKSVGFIMEGFPHDPEQVDFMLERQLFPDVVVVMEVEATDVQRRLLPGYLEKWRMLYHKHEEQIKLLQHLRQKNRDEMIAKRTAELIELQEADESRFTEEADDSTNMEEIDAILEVEFPETGFNEDIEEQETEEAATEWIEEEIEDRFEKDSANIMSELISEYHIPKLEFNASQKLEKIQNHMLHKIKPMITNRESLFLSCQHVSYRLSHNLLLYSYKLNSAFGCADPVEVSIIKENGNPFIYFFRTKENRSKFTLNPLKYLRQPTPTTSFPIKIAVTGPPKAGKTTVSKMFADKYGLARLSIGAAMRLVLNYKAHTNLAAEMKKYLTQGLVVPDELAVQCLGVALLSSVCSIRGYVLDGFPMTLHQVELMESQNIIPILVFELHISTVEVLLRGLSDKMNPNNSEILHSWDSSYKKEVEHVRPYFQEQHQNWFMLDGSKNKWWLWKNILQQVDISMKCVNSYMKRRYSGKAACINRLCITPKELNSRIGEFGHYCPVCLALFHHLEDCSETADLTHAAEYKKLYYRLCGGNHLEIFLSNPDEFLAPCCPYNLPGPHLLPRKLTELQVKNKFPQQIELKGFCPVTFKDGNQRYEALVRGLMQYAVEYKEKLYIFETKEKQQKFMRMPELYCDQKLPCKVPPLDEPVPLTSLPTLGYLEQGVAEAVIKAMTAVGSLKPKYPFVSVKRSALVYVAFYLKAFNQKSTGCLRQKYKKKLASFEENCELITYLSSAMTGAYKPPGERPIDFDFKLNRFMALGAPGATDSL